MHVLLMYRAAIHTACTMYHRGMLYDCNCNVTVYTNLVFNLVLCNRIRTFYSTINHRRQ